MPRSKRSYSAAAKKAAATRKRNAEFARRSASARKGWATRRKNSAQAAIKTFMRRPGGRNVTKGGKVEPYHPSKFGITYAQRRYDFRGLSKKRIAAMRDLVLQAAPGRLMRMLIVTTNEAAWRRLTTSGSYERAIHLGNQKPGQPFWFWTEPRPVDSSLDAFEQITGVFENETEVGEVKIVLVEIL